tara:strand:- start:56243 stop:57673 length:1431 start_codon:yes stop_codon:yes gene_type:complete
MSATDKDSAAWPAPEQSSGGNQTPGDKSPGQKAAGGDGATAPKSSTQHGLMMRVVLTFSSMKLAVVLLVVLGLLTWLGTLAQIDGGLWATQKEYFESWGLIAELPLSWWGSEIPSAKDQWVIKIPLPGAYPVMLLLFLNLLVGGMVRLKWRAKNAGVLITHIGIALLLVAGFVKMEYSYSGGLALYETPTSGPEVANRQYESSTFVSFHDYELALIKDAGDTVEERVIPESKLLGAIDDTVTLTGEGLPFELQLHHYLVNCRPLPKGPMVRATTPVLDEPGGPGIYLQPMKTNPQREHNRTGVYVRVMVRGQQHAEGIIWGPDNLPIAVARFPFVFEVDGTRWAVDLRKVTYELPFKMRLQKFVKRDHPGTLTPADFRSTVTVDDGSSEREVQIYMNTPLRKDGYVAYQTNWGPQQPGMDGRPLGPPWYSVFEVAANPSDQWPMWSCWVIGLGIFVHMIMKLSRFLNSSTRANMTA